MERKICRQIWGLIHYVCPPSSIFFLLGLCFKTKPTPSNLILWPKFLYFVPVFLCICLSTQSSEKKMRQSWSNPKNGGDNCNIHLLMQFMYNCVLCSFLLGTKVIQKWDDHDMNRPHCLNIYFFKNVSRTMSPKVSLLQLVFIICRLEYSWNHYV